ncbi:hypothetical protein BCR41DRAFT_390551 [Lobosporangium transversale]|uniref:Uncharacterized protein n=1 Tax=Lobosporangium transversale TaxID=64571 RepID=A0A1Y2G8A6_9FUNG|nr:hypothetical protein BCR41DRAFT_390551 [Lobosporangium transversale]ORY98323.1 hypothetical protein BCR41DRAFT_390551 [Lobosporangium transversale]|eukprot:XP_021875734.1 hypothetical protein BCR41DRAFT_390551 [Lobosporangium transversale]
MITKDYWVMGEDNVGNEQWAMCNRTGMTTQTIKLFCILEDISSAFPVKLDVEDTITIPDQGIYVNLGKIDSPIPLTKGTTEITEVPGAAPAKETIHVIFQRLSAVLTAFLRSHKCNERNRTNIAIHRSY